MSRLVNYQLLNVYFHLDGLCSSTETKKGNKSSLLEKFQEEMAKEISLLQNSMNIITQELDSPTLLDPDSVYEEIMQTLEKVQKSIEKVKEKANTFTEYEKRFGFPESEFLEIDTAEFNLYHLNLLWESLEKWDSWSQNALTVDFNTLSVEECRSTVKKFTNTLDELKATDEPNEVLTLLDSKVMAFSSKITCIDYLRSPMLKDRHWKKIESIVGVDISAGVNLQFITDRGVFEKEVEIKKVFEKAKAEGKLEDLLVHLENKWKQCSLETMNVMECNVISSFSPIWIMIEDSIEIIKVTFF